MARVKLKNRAEVAQGTMAFYLQKPPGFVFEAGQFLDVTLVDPPETDDQGSTRAFTIASAPHEEDLMVATRLRDTSFKRVLKNLPLGAELEIEGPYGTFTLHEDSKRSAAFLAGGISITPFRSMVLEAAHGRWPHRLQLFYSNRRPEDAPFLDELMELAKANPRYRFIGTMTKMENSSRPWKRETGLLRRELLARFLEDLAEPIYYVVGPPGMVEALRKTLLEAGIPKCSLSQIIVGSGRAILATGKARPRGTTPKLRLAVPGRSTAERAQRRQETKAPASPYKNLRKTELSTPPASPTATAPIPGSSSNRARRVHFRDKRLICLPLPLVPEHARPRARFI